MYCDFGTVNKATQMVTAHERVWNLRTIHQQLVCILCSHAANISDLGTTPPQINCICSAPAKIYGIREQINLN
jgi:hypothetical protein